MRVWRLPRAGQVNPEPETLNRMGSTPGLGSGSQVWCLHTLVARSWVARLVHEKAHEVRFNVSAFKKNIKHTSET